MTKQSEINEKENVRAQDSLSHVLSALIAMVSPKWSPWTRGILYLLYML